MLHTDPPVASAARSSSKISPTFPALVRPTPMVDDWLEAKSLPISKYMSLSALGSHQEREGEREVWKRRKYRHVDNTIEFTLNGKTLVVLLNHLGSYAPSCQQTRYKGKGHYEESVIKVKQVHCRPKMYSHGTFNMPSGIFCD